MTDEERKKRHLAGMKRWHRRVDRQVEELFVELRQQEDGSGPDRYPDAAEFSKAYYDKYGEYLPLIYARAQTEFGEQYGSDIGWEDAGCGEFRPPRHFHHGETLEEYSERKIEEEIALADAYYDSLKPEERKSPEDTESKSTADEWPPDEELSW